MTAASDVRHNETDHQFELPVDGDLAFVTYYRNGDVIEFLHTEVPEAAEGKGIASKVVSAALQYAEAHGLRVVARFVRGQLSPQAPRPVSGAGRRDRLGMTLPSYRHTTHASTAVAITKPESSAM